MNFWTVGSVRISNQLVLRSRDVFSASHHNGSNDGAAGRGQQPCTSFVEQQQRSPIRFFRSARPNQSIPSSSILPSTNPLMNLSAWLRRCDAERHLPRSWLCIGQPATAMQQAGYVSAQRTAVCVPVGMTMWNGRWSRQCHGLSRSDSEATQCYSRAEMVYLKLPLSIHCLAIRCESRHDAWTSSPVRMLRSTLQRSTPSPAPLDAYRYAPAPSTMDRESKANF